MSLGRGNCPGCGTAFNVRSSSIGTMRRCQACGAKFVLSGILPKKSSSSPLVGCVAVFAIAIVLLVILTIIIGIVVSAGRKHLATLDTTAFKPDQALPGGAPSRPVAIVPPVITRQPPAILAPRTADQIVNIKQKLARDAALVTEAENASFRKMEADSSYARAAKEKESASQAARDGDADGAQRLMVATQSLSDLRRAALSHDANVLAARAVVEADEVDLVNLLKRQDANVATADMPGAVAASTDRGQASSMMGGGLGNEYVRGYYRKDGTYVAGYVRNSPGSGHRK